MSRGGQRCRLYHVGLFILLIFLYNAARVNKKAEPPLLKWQSGYLCTEAIPLPKRPVTFRPNLTIGLALS